jgi:hypothetical protein
LFRFAREVRSGLRLVGEGFLARLQLSQSMEMFGRDKTCHVAMFFIQTTFPVLIALTDKALNNATKLVVRFKAHS